MPSFKERQAEEKKQKELEKQADDILQNKLDRKTASTPTLDEVVASIPRWKYGGIFNLSDGEVHYRVTIPDLGRVIHCHTSNTGHVLTRAHMKPKIREVGGDTGAIKAAAEKGKLTKHGAHGLEQVGVWEAKGVPSELEQLVRDRLKNGNYAASLVAAATNMQDIELTFYAYTKSNNGWGPFSLADRGKHRQIVQAIVNISGEIIFPCPPL
jgi:hypothetical protein